MYSGVVGVVTPNRHQPTSVHLPPIRSTNATDTPAQSRAAGSLTQSRTAGRRAAADAELNLISSYHQENYSKPFLLHFIQGDPKSRHTDQ